MKMCGQNVKFCTDEDLAINEEKFLKMKHYNLTNPLTAGKLHIFYMSYATKEEFQKLQKKK